MNDDSRLRECFASLRRAEEATTPGFERIMGRTRLEVRVGFRGLAAAASIVLVALTGMIFWVSHRHPSPTQHAAAPMLADWRSPTDFLLKTPGQDLLHTVPPLGVYPAQEPILHPLNPTIAPAHGAGRGQQTSRNAGRGRHAAPRGPISLARLKTGVSRGEIG